MPTDVAIEVLDAAFLAFALGPESHSQPTPSATDYSQLVFAEAAADGVRSMGDEASHFAALRLRLAFDLAPVAALDYITENPTPRWELIRRELVDRFPETPEALLETLARRVARTLANWERQRQPAGSVAALLRRTGGNRCSACKFTFGSIGQSIEFLDPFKPFKESPDELCLPEVDHIIPISSLGTNEITNLQLLCRWCNQGKSDGLGVDVRKEAEYAGSRIAEIPRAHRARMFYSALARCRFTCVKCKGSSVELTIRKRRPTTGFTLRNLLTVCYSCARTLPPP